MPSITTKMTDDELSEMIESSLRKLNDCLQEAELRDMVITIDKEENDIQGFHRTRLVLRAIMKRLYKPLIIRP